MKSKEATEVKRTKREDIISKTTMGDNGITVLINKANGIVANQVLVRINGILPIVNKIVMAVNGIIANQALVRINGTLPLANKVIMAVNGTVPNQVLKRTNGTVLVANKTTIATNGTVVIQILLVNGMPAAKQAMETIKEQHGIITITEANNGTTTMANNNIKAMEMAAAMIKETIGTMLTSGIIKQVMEMRALVTVILMGKVKLMAPQINGLLTNNS